MLHPKYERLLVPGSLYRMFGTLRHRAVYNNPLSVPLHRRNAPLPPLAPPLSSPIGTRLSGCSGMSWIQRNTQF
jgi:hypothetical protein